MQKALLFERFYDIKKIERLDNQGLTTSTSNTQTSKSVNRLRDSTTGKSFLKKLKESTRL